jgi:hypothetical protein
VAAVEPSNASSSDDSGTTLPMPGAASMVPPGARSLEEAGRSPALARSPEAGGQPALHACPCEIDFDLTGAEGNVGSEGEQSIAADPEEPEVESPDAGAEAAYSEGPDAADPEELADPEEPAADEAECGDADAEPEGAVPPAEKPQADSPCSETPRLPGYVRVHEIVSAAVEVADTQLGDTQVDGDTHVDGNTEVDGDTQVDGNTQLDGDTQSPLLSLGERPERPAAPRGSKRIRSAWEVQTWAAEHPELASEIPTDLYPVCEPGRFSWTVPSPACHGLRVEVLLKAKALVVKGVAADVPFLANSNNRRQVAWNHKGSFAETWRWVKADLAW